jgi:spore coat protein U-like protein
VSATSLDFGSQSALTSAVDTTNTISLTCSSGTAYTVGLNNGNSGGTGPTARMMANAGTTDKVTYGIYLDAARSQVWGDGTMGSVASGTGNGTAQNFTGYGRIPVQTSPSAFDYNDTVVVTVTY